MTHITTAAIGIIVAETDDLTYPPNHGFYRTTIKVINAFNTTLLCKAHLIIKHLDQESLTIEALPIQVCLLQVRIH